MNKLFLALLLSLGTTSAFAQNSTPMDAPTSDEAVNAAATCQSAQGEGCTPEGAYIQWFCGCHHPSGYGWVRVAPRCWHRDTGRRCD